MHLMKPLPDSKLKIELHVMEEPQPTDLRCKLNHAESLNIQLITEEAANTRSTSSQTFSDSNGLVPTVPSMGFPPLKQVRCSIPDGHADATEAYERALFDLYSEVTEDADKVRFGVPVLPAPSNQVEDYLLFHLSVANPKGEDIETVILAIRIYDLCIVGFKSRFAAFFYKDGPPLHIQQQIFPGLGEDYFTVACHIFFGDKRTLSLGFGVLVQEIKHLAAQRSGFGNGRNPFGDTDDGIINGLCVCEQMFTESIRFPNIKKELIKVASLAWNANGCLEYPACILPPHLVHMQKKWKLFYGPITQDGKSEELKEKVKFRYLDEQFNKVTAVYKELSQLKNIIALIPGNWEWELQQVQIYDVDDYEDDFTFGTAGIVSLPVLINYGIECLERLVELRAITEPLLLEMKEISESNNLINQEVNTFSKQVEVKWGASEFQHAMTCIGEINEGEKIDSCIKNTQYVAAVKADEIMKEEASLRITTHMCTDSIPKEEAVSKKQRSSVAPSKQVCEDNMEECF